MCTHSLLCRVVELPLKIYLLECKVKIKETRSVLHAMKIVMNASYSEIESKHTYLV